MNTKFWNTSMFLILVISFLNSSFINLINTAFPLIIERVGGSAADLGTLSALMTFASMLINPFVGQFLDRFGRRIVLLGGTVILVGSSIAYGITTSILMLAIIRILNGFGNSAQRTSLSTMVSDVTEPKNLAKGIGYLNMAMTMTSAMMPLFALYLIQNHGFNLFFGFTIALMSLALALSTRLNYEKNRKVDKPSITAKPFSHLFESHAIGPSIFIALTGVTISGIFTFVVPYALSLGIENIGFFFTAYALAYLVIRVPLDVFQKRFGLGNTVLLGFASTILAYFILANANNLIRFMVVGALIGIGMSALLPTLQTLAVQNSPEHRRGSANATFFLAMDSSFGLGAILIGFLATALSYADIYRLSALFALASMLAFTLSLYRKHQ